LELLVVLRIFTFFFGYQCEVAALGFGHDFRGVIIMDASAIVAEFVAQAKLLRVVNPFLNEDFRGI
jgi:hypothetical protein